MFRQCEVLCDLPSDKIYEFNGTFIYPKEKENSEMIEIQEQLTLENTLWTNTVLAS